MDCSGINVSTQNLWIHRRPHYCRSTGAMRIKRHGLCGGQRVVRSSFSSRGNHADKSVTLCASHTARTLERRSVERKHLENVWRELGVTKRTTLDRLVDDWEGCNAQQLRSRLQNMKRTLRLSDRDLRDMANNKESVLLNVSLCTIACRIAEVRDSLPFNTDTFSW